MYITLSHSYYYTHTIMHLPAFVRHEATRSTTDLLSQAGRVGFRKTEKHASLLHGRREEIPATS